MNVIPFNRYPEIDNLTNPLYARFNEQLALARPVEFQLTVPIFTNMISKALAGLSFADQTQINQEAFMIEAMCTDANAVCGWLNAVRWTQRVGYTDLFVADCESGDEVTDWPRPLVMFQLGRGLSLHSRFNRFNNDIDFLTVEENKTKRLNTPILHVTGTHVPEDDNVYHGCISHHLVNAVIDTFVLDACMWAGGIEIQQETPTTRLYFSHPTSGRTVVEWTLSIDNTIYPSTILSVE